MAFRAEDDEDEVAGPSHPNFIQHSRSGLGENLVLFRAPMRTGLGYSSGPLFESAGGHQRRVYSTVSG
jgi:hypothetical protein